MDMDNDSFELLKEMLSDHNDEVKKRIIESVMVLEEYTPKFEEINISLKEFINLIKNQKETLNNSSAVIINKLESCVDSLSKKVTDLSIKSKKIQFTSYISIFISTLIICSCAGFYFAYIKSESLYFQDSRYKKLNAYEEENKKLRHEYSLIISTMEKLKEKGCVISDKMLLAPQSIVKTSGESRDEKFVGVWMID